MSKLLLFIVRLVICTFSLFCIITPSFADCPLPPVPNGFEYIEGNWDRGFVIEDAYGNQWVWVPVDSIEGGLVRRDFNEGLLLENTSEELPAQIKNKIAEFGGFYVARYEASKDGNKVVISAREEIWKEAEWEKANNACKRMGADYGYKNVLTHLLYDVEWDSIVKWLEDSGYNIHDSSMYGNYSKLDVTGIYKTNEIFDLAGNVWEWTMGKCGSSHIVRGGSCANLGEVKAVSIREYYKPDDEHEFVGFRPAFVPLNYSSCTTLVKLQDKKLIKVPYSKSIRSLADFISRYGQEGYDAYSIYGEDLIKNGTPSLTPYPVAELSVDKEYDIYQTPTFKLKIKNTGKGELYKVVAKIKTNDVLKTNNYLFFGMIPPGKEIERTYKFRVPTAKNAGENIDFEIEFFEANDNIPEKIKGIVKIADNSREIIVDRMFNRNYKYNAEQLLDLKTNKVIDEQIIQRYVLLRYDVITLNDLLLLARNNVDLKNVIDKLVRYSKKRFTPEEMLQLASVGSIAAPTVDYLVLNDNISIKKGQILVLARLNSVSKNTVDELYRQRKVDFSKDEIDELLRLGKLTAVNILYTYKIIDDGSGGSVGNGDGRIQKKEGIDLQLTIKNNSQFELKNVRIQAESSDSAIAFNNSIVNLPVFKPDENKIFIPNFTVKTKLNMDKVSFKLIVESDKFGNVLSEDINIPLDTKAPEQIIALAKKVVSKSKITVFSGADSTSTAIATISDGSIFNVTGELNGMYRVSMNMDFGWIQKTLTADYVEQVDKNILADNLLDNQDDKANIVRVFENARPEIFIISPENNARVNDNEIDLVVEGRDRVNGIASFLIKVNDIPLQGSSERGLVLSKNDDTGKTRKTYRIKLRQGLNRIEVVAFNGKFLESNPEIIDIYNTGKKIKPNLWILSIGVSKYKNPENNLSLADVDAKTIANVFGTQAGKLFDKVYTKVLVNEEVTRESIMQAKDSFLGQASSDDMIVTFFAGHGVLDKNNKYYFLTSDTDPQNPSIRGISQSTLKEDILSSVVANKSVFMFDTCHSGNITQLSTRSILDIDKVVDDLYKGTGQFIMSASKGNEFAYENASWGNGAFTLAIKNALLQGKADIDKDGFIDIYEFQKYVNETVPQITDGKQHPKTTNIDFDNIKFFTVN